MATRLRCKQLPFCNGKLQKSVAKQRKMAKNSCHATENRKKQLPCGNSKSTKKAAHAQRAAFFMHTLISVAVGHFLLGTLDHFLNQ
ncbi:MAG: hypothetical protein IJZ34_09620, partial [Lachnospiraceae bacterium]|nr:hypothetical protein [Lachnospiraceae bacterium]